MLQLCLPPPPGVQNPPVWTGRGFQVDNELVEVLSYEVGASGWSDELTEFSEDSAGEHHYMDVASRERAYRALARNLKHSTAVLMDVGCSSGFMLKTLKDRFPQAAVIGADYVPGPLHKLSRAMPDTPLLQFDLVKCPLPSDSVDGITALNVLEHIEDDLGALKQIHRVLKPNGIAVFEVPAGPHLYDVYDKQLMHFRRYEMSSFVEKLGAAGLEIIDHSHIGAFLYPAFAMVKKRNQRFLNEDEAIQRKIVSGNINQSKSSPLMHHIMRFEAALGRLVYYPFGIRCVATCRKSAPSH
jgi:SAM-dependent methyltransferase